MKPLIIIVLGFTMLWSCKEDSNQVTQTGSEQSTLKTDSVSRPPIKVFTVVHDSTSIGDTEQLTELNKGLDKSFKEDKHLEDEYFINGYLKSYRNQSFPKLLARDFENDNFTKAIRTHATFLEVKHRDAFTDLKVEEWVFKDKSTAISCFESLTTHEERIIYFKAINWIWVQQKNKLFLIFALDLKVDYEQMQTVKRHLIDDLKDQGVYDVVEIGSKSNRFDTH